MLPHTSCRSYADSRMSLPTKRPANRNQSSLDKVSNQVHIWPNAHVSECTKCILRRWPVCAQVPSRIDWGVAAGRFQPGSWWNEDATAAG